MPESLDVVVIGGGTAGLVTASGCARLGRKVALIEREKLGGDCLWTGCVPTKALVATARLVHQMQHADAYGLDAQTVRVTPKSIMDSMRAQRHAIEHHDDPEKFRALGVDVIFGEATFVSRNEVEVGGRRLAAKDIVIATGTRTATPPVEGLAEHGFLDHASFLEQDAFPASLLILGGGYIGIEFAQIFRRFGSDVVVVEMLDEIINKEDAGVIARIRRILTEEGIGIRTGWAAKSVRMEAEKKVVRIENKLGETMELPADEIFVASGRRANTEKLGLESAGVKANRGFVVVDKYLQTSVPRIWACGDVHGGMQFTHVAAYEAVKLVRNMLFPGRSAVSYDNVPWGLYTDPEVGHIGMTEAEAVAAHGADNVRTYSVEMAEVDRAVIDRTTGGFVKLVCNQRGHILGAHALCANASTLIETLVLARQKKVTVAQLAQLISPYPSLADALQKAASMYYQDVAKGWLGSAGKTIAAWSQ
ncbi:MAG TPA: FAD-dependent oxidoreductase [Thermoanaerobaculia bacterium]|jgi:pyruvate/2-oxoglutarate dehydrogenase complex dihydrolipoamide dehydrogenase (E3) component|nr:FAD-dependent oxidoreductase [Thermoanaerobaculia bacterium]